VSLMGGADAAGGGGGAGVALVVFIETQEEGLNGRSPNEPRVDVISRQVSLLSTSGLPVLAWRQALQLARPFTCWPSAAGPAIRLPLNSCMHSQLHARSPSVSPPLLPAGPQ
jgi:hypothetical protein